MTENYAALDILKHYLSGVDSSQTLNAADVKQETMEPFVLFGSSFPKDQEYTQVRRWFILLGVPQQALGLFPLWMNVEFVFQEDNPYRPERYFYDCACA